MNDIKYKMASLCFIFYMYCLNYLLYNSSTAFMINKSFLNNKKSLNANAFNTNKNVFN